MFESLGKVCISIFPQLIWKKIKEILKSHAYHIQVAYKTVKLSSCRTYNRIPVQMHSMYMNVVYQRVEKLLVWLHFFLPENGEILTLKNTYL